MSIPLHRTGIAAILDTLTAADTPGKLAMGFSYPKRDFADSTLAWPFWTLMTSTCPPERFDTAGDGGQNDETVITRVHIYGQHKDGAASYIAFLTLFSSVLTEFRSDSNMRLGQEEELEPCVENIIGTHSVTFPQSAPHIILGTIDFHAKYIVSR